MTAEVRPRLFVVEDHDIVRLGIERLLGERFHLVGSADEVGSAIELIRERAPDVVLLDVRIPGGGGAVVVERLRDELPDVKFLAFTVSTSRQDVVRLMGARADGYVVKTTDREQLIEFIDQVLAGGTPISPEVAGHLLNLDDAAEKLSSFARLTDREREVATHIARGYKYREAADRLEMSVKTLETHVHHIFEKLGVQSRHKLADMAVQEGFVRPDTAAVDLPTGTVTFLMTDIVGSSELWERRPGAMSPALRRHDDLLVECVVSERGRIVSHTGDGVLAVFQRAGWAVMAAVKAQVALREVFPEIGQLGVRIVLATGEADERDGNYFGPVVNQTARLLEVCEAGQVLVSGVTREIAGSAMPPGFIWRKVDRKVLRQAGHQPVYELRQTP